MFLSSVKSSPEEWRQSLITVKTKEGARVDPISCNVGGASIFPTVDCIDFCIAFYSCAASVCANRLHSYPHSSNRYSHVSIAVLLLPRPTATIPFRISETSER